MPARFSLSGHVGKQKAIEAYQLYIKRYMMAGGLRPMLLR